MRNYDRIFKRLKTISFVFSLVAKFLDLVKMFRLKLSTSLVDEIMNAFMGPNNNVDPKELKSFYLQEYPETTAPKEKKLKKKKLTKNRK